MYISCLYALHCSSMLNYDKWKFVMNINADHSVHYLQSLSRTTQLRCLKLSVQVICVKFNVGIVLT